MDNDLILGRLFGGCGIIASLLPLSLEEFTHRLSASASALESNRGHAFEVAEKHNVYQNSTHGNYMCRYVYYWKQPW